MRQYSKIVVRSKILSELFPSNVKLELEEVKDLAVFNEVHTHAPGSALVINRGKPPQERRLVVWPDYPANCVPITLLPSS